MCVPGCTEHVPARCCERSAGCERRGMLACSWHLAGDSSAVPSCATCGPVAVASEMCNMLYPRCNYVKKAG